MELPSLIFLGIAITGLLVTWVSSSSKLDPNEPPEVLSSVPIVGHIAGLIKRTFHYNVDLALQNRSNPIFTIRFLGQKFYVITSVDLMLAVQKQYKALSFKTVEAEFSGAVGGFGSEFMRILKINLNSEDGDWGLVEDVHHAFKNTLKPGTDLDDMNREMIKVIGTALDQLEPIPGEAKQIQFWAWARNVITEATTKSVYGPANPYNDQNVIDDFWTFEAGMMRLILPMPHLLAREPLAARNRVTDAFMKYYENGGHKLGSALTRERYEAHMSNGLDLLDMSRSETANGIGIMVNTSPAAFWTLFMIFATPGLLAEIRSEIDAVTNVTTENGTQHRHLDVASIKETCPLLASTYQEVLRWRSVGMSVRRVNEDHLLEGKWLLKKGALIQMPVRAVHLEPTIWGTDVEEFNPRRFLKGERQMTETGKRPKDSSFRSFGGGKTLCPGRHFATNEVLSFTSIFVARLDMEPLSGRWVLPPSENTVAASLLSTPDQDIAVSIRRRAGMEDCKWTMTLEEAGKVFALVSEDQE